jgi:hypothetical protein
MSNLPARGLAALVGLRGGPAGASKPATASGLPAGKIGALAGFEIGSGPWFRYRETVSR